MISIIKITFVLLVLYVWVELMFFTYGFYKKDFDRWFGSNKFMGILLSISAWPVLWIGFLFYYSLTIIMAFWIHIDKEKEIEK